MSLTTHYRLLTHIPYPTSYMAYKIYLINMRGIYKQDRNRHDRYNVKTYLNDNEQASHKGLQTT